MTTDITSDDVIRIRIDTAGAVRDFLAQLAAQAALGETEAPANPPNRAIFRELAPFRLVEYAHVEPSAGDIETVLVGFPDGSLYPAAADIPEEAVDALVAAHGGELADLPPLYIYVVLAAPAPMADIDGFLGGLAAHLDTSLVTLAGDGAGAMSVRVHHGLAAPRGEAARRLEAAIAAAARDGAYHLGKAGLMERLNAASLASDGRAWASLTFDFERHLMEFPSQRERDDFVGWSQRLCGWLYARAATWQDLGFDTVFHPAEITPRPDQPVAAPRLRGPSDFAQGRPWQAFTTTDPAEAMTIAREYWTYVCDALARSGAD